MKNKVLLIIICLFTFILPIMAEDKIAYQETIDYPGIRDIVSYKEGYFILDKDNYIKKYNLAKEEITSKELSNIIIHKMVKLDNSIIIIGEKDNLINIYILDESLRTIKNQEIEMLINNSTVNSYIYDNQIYIILSFDGILSSNKAIVIDKDNNINIKQLSEIPNIEEVLGADYYIFSSNDSTVKYLASTTLNNEKYLVGYKENEEQVIGIINNISSNNIVMEQDYINKDIITINNSIAVLSKKDNLNKLIIYSEDNQVLQNIPFEGNAIKLAKIHNNLVIICEEKIILYNYELNIIKDENIFGQLNLIGESKPYNEIKIEIIPNSGYEVEKVNVITTSGQKVNIYDSKFIMPENSVKISVNYKEVIVNPETSDAIIWIIIASLLTIVLFKKFYTKYKWLK